MSNSFNCGSLKGYKVATYTDFGVVGRKELIGRHKHISTAMRQYAKLWKIYGRPYPGHKVWQEMIKLPEHLRRNHALQQSV